MKKWLNLLLNYEKNYTELACNNRKEIEKFNEKILSSFTFLGGILILLPLLATPFSNTKAEVIPLYLLGISIYFAMYFIFKLPAMKKYTLCGLYITFSLLFLSAIYLSVIHSPHMRATILLGTCCIMPLGFIDNPVRINIFVAFWMSVHTILAFFLKPQYALDDTINGLCFAILGCFIGNKMIQVRLKSYEASRLLTIEKETDILTGLFNRRKLFETIDALERTKVEKPTGIFMIDIDHFKRFNDNYGHIAGDRCLEQFGKVLIALTQNFRIQFYRYGGEEFVAMAYGYTENELFSIAERLRNAAQSSDRNKYKITVSIGVAYCGQEQVPNYEKIIDQADKAVYAAKHKGRNRVCIG